MERPVRMASEPFLTLVLFMRRVVVEGHMAGLLLRHSALDAIEETDDLSRALGWHGCLARRTGLVAQEAIDTFVHEAFLPAPHTGLGLNRRGLAPRGGKAVTAEQDDTGRPNVLLRAQGRHHNAAQALAVGFG